MAVDDLKLVQTVLPNNFYFWYMPQLAYILGTTNEAILVSYLLYWHGLGTRRDGFIYKNERDMRLETGLSGNRQRAAIEKCIENGFLVVENRSIPQTRHFRIDVEKLINHITKSPKTTELTQRLVAKSNNEKHETITESYRDLAKEVDNIYQHYLRQNGFPSSQCRLTSKRRVLISERLTDIGYERSCAAVSNCAASDLYNGTLDDRFKGTIEFIFRDYETTENLANLGGGF